MDHLSNTCWFKKIQKQIFEGLGNRDMAALDLNTALSSQISIKAKVL